MEISKHAFAPIKDGTIRLIFKSKGKQVVLNIDTDEPFGESLKKLFKEYTPKKEDII